MYFTKPGARKLAHYVEREINRLLASRSAPIELPTEPATPDANAQPGQPAPRPLAGPILPLVASSVGTDQLLGGPGSRPAAVDALAARTLVKGEPLAPPAGRADDFAWPRREVGREQAKGETPVAAVAPDGAVATPGTPVAPAKPLAPKKPPLPVQSSAPPSVAPAMRDFFSFGNAPKKPIAPAPRAPRCPASARAMSDGRPRCLACSRGNDHDIIPGRASARTRNPAATYLAQQFRDSGSARERVSGNDWAMRSAVIAPARRRPARLTRHQQSERKADAAGDQERAERIVLHLLRHRLRAVAEGIA